MQLAPKVPEPVPTNPAGIVPAKPAPRMEWADDLAQTLVEHLGVTGIAILRVDPSDPLLLGAFPRSVYAGYHVFRTLARGEDWFGTTDCGLTSAGFAVRDVRGEIVGGVVLITEEERVEEALAGLRALTPFFSASLESAARSTTVNLEHRLRQAQARLRSLTNAVQVGVIVLDPRGFIREANYLASTILGYDSEQLMGMHFRDLIAPEEHDLARERFEKRMRGLPAPERSEYQVIRGDGARRLILATAAPLYEEDRVVGIYFAARDITDERAREAELRRAERFSGLAPLLGGVCHELNNPLTSIKSFAELMLLDDRPEEDRESLEIVRREAERAARIVTDLKLVARQTQSDGPSVAPVQVNEVIRQVVSSMEEEIAPLEVDISLALAPSAPEICASRPQLERVVAQLLSNALHAVQAVEGPRFIELSTTPSADGVQIAVSDSGPGIPDGDVERIFDPFWTTRTTGEGTGLGLSLVHSIVRDHNGQIRVDGGAGTGATFVIDLPGMELEERAPHEPTVQDPARRALRLLIVDDEGPIRFSLGRYMNRRGHTVEEAEEGERALALIEGRPPEEQFDIILADLRMPGLNGEQLYQRLRERKRGDEERLIFITGDAESPDAARLVHEAGVPVVLKPFELAEIAQIIEAQADVIG